MRKFIEKYRFLGGGLIFCAAVFGTVIFSGTVIGAAQNQSVAPGNTLQNSPAKNGEIRSEYRLTTSNGPWLIVAASFAGAKAQDDAQGLAAELHTRHQLKVYVHHMTFVHQMDKKAAGRAKFLKNPRSDEWAVLVGDFPELNHPQLEKTLKTLKILQPESLDVRAGRGTSQMYRDWRLMFAPEERVEKEDYPMTRAMAITNPLLPAEFFTRGGTIDEFIVKLNSRVQYCLLDNPGQYTVRIGTFTGKTIVDQQQIKDYLAGKKIFPKEDISDLEKAALAATTLCAVLRQKGYEAYIFHDRYESIVTIGAFDVVAIPMANGSLIERPEIADIREKCTGKFSSPRPGQPMSYQPVIIAGIELDYEPKVIPVPRKPR